MNKISEQFRKQKCRIENYPDRTDEDFTYNKISLDSKHTERKTMTHWSLKYLKHKM